MTMQEINSWRDIQAEVLRRIHNRTWKPGELIPNEADLAIEFGCARATVNRALRELANAGILDRRRKAGTRVAMHPVRKATLDIPIIRKEIEAKGFAYGYALISEREETPPPEVCARMEIGGKVQLTHLVCVHLAGGKPYVFEDRWIDQRIVPDITEANFKIQSPNEWLVENAPFTNGDFAFSATNASQKEAEILACKEGEALFAYERRTWDVDKAITSVRLTFAPGYRMHTEI